jgi:hypothetical protein
MIKLIRRLTSWLAELLCFKRHDPRTLHEIYLDRYAQEFWGCTRKLLYIDRNHKKVLESDVDFRQRIKGMYEFNE